MRIEEDGAYSGLVNGSPADFGAPQQQRRRRGAVRLDEEDDEAEAAAAVRADDEGQPLDPRCVGTMLLLLSLPAFMEFGSCYVL